MLAKIITEAFRKYEKQLVEKIENTLTADDRCLLDDLLAEDDVYQMPEKHGVKIKRYNLTRLKRTNHSEERRPELYEQIRRSSIVYWQHINLLGEFDFSDEKLKNGIQFQLPKILDLKVV